MNDLRISPSATCRQIPVLESWGQRLGRHLPMIPMRGWLRTCFHYMLSWQSRGKGFVCQLPGGEQIHILPEFRHISWNLDEYTAFKANCPRGGIVLDVGANLGCYSLLFSQWVGPSGQVYAFEPAMDTFCGLQQLIELNEAQDVVHPVQQAMSDASGEVVFRSAGLQGDNRIMADHEDDTAEVIRIPTVSIDEFCAAQQIQPHLIKIDVEGYELDVLRGAQETIRAARQHLALFVEMHPTTWQLLGIHKDDITAELRRQNLRAEPLARADDPWSIEGCCMRLLPDA